MGCCAVSTGKYLATFRSGVLHQLSESNTPRIVDRPDPEDILLRITAAIISISQHGLRMTENLNRNQHHFDKAPNVAG